MQRAVILGPDGDIRESAAVCEVVSTPPTRTLVCPDAQIQVSPQERKAVIDAFADPTLAYRNGVYVAGNKFVILRSTGQSLCGKEASVAESVYRLGYSRLITCLPCLRLAAVGVSWPRQNKRL